MYDTDVKTEHQIPVSSGVPPIVKLASFIGFCIIIAILSTVVWTSMQGHVWPAQDVTKIKL